MISDKSRNHQKLSEQCRKIRDVRGVHAPVHVCDDVLMMDGMMF